MKEVYLASVEEFTFDNAFDNFVHNEIFTNKESAIAWSGDKARHIGKVHNADVYEEYPDNFEKAHPFVYWKVEKKTIQE